MKIKLTENSSGSIKHWDHQEWWQHRIVWRTHRWKPVQFMPYNCNTDALYFRIWALWFRFKIALCRGIVRFISSPLNKIWQHCKLHAWAGPAILEYRTFDTLLIMTLYRPRKWHMGSKHYVMLHTNRSKSHHEYIRFAVLQVLPAAFQLNSDEVSKGKRKQAVAQNQTTNRIN